MDGRSHDAGESRTVGRWRTTKDAPRSGGANVVEALADYGCYEEEDAVNVIAIERLVGWKYDEGNDDGEDFANGGDGGGERGAEISRQEGEKVGAEVECDRSSE